jgi:hypothetical protein
MRWLAHPLTRGLDINDPSTVQAQRQITQQQGFLGSIYRQIEYWLAVLPHPMACLAARPGYVRWNLHAFLLRTGSQASQDTTLVRVRMSRRWRGSP